MDISRVVRTKNSTTHLFAAAIANAMYHRTYNPATREFEPNPKTFILTACGQILASEPKFIPMPSRGLGCGDCRSIYVLVSEGVDVTNDIV